MKRLDNQFAIVAVDRSGVRKFNTRLYKWHKNNARQFPWRNSSDLYPLLIAEILLQKTNADKVVSAYQELLRRYPSPESLSRAHRGTLKKIIRPLGLVGKVEILKSMSKQLAASKDTEPNLDKLLAMKGIGEYMARSVLIHSRGTRLSLLDPNFVRIYERVFGVRSNRSRPRCDKALWQKAYEFMPRANPSKYVYAMLDFGALVCRASKPKCSDCPMSGDLCNG